tara:strand:- start:900 stop:1910 length:1011 start_codon:yes stop_codon:yes gene_type:complete
MAETHTDHRGWEIDFSTRQSVHPSTRYVPFRLAAATTAANLITLNPRTRPASNWVTNPRLSGTDISMFTPIGLTTSNTDIERSTAQQSLGTHSLLVSPTGAADAEGTEGFYWTTPTIGLSHTKSQQIIAQCAVRGYSISGTPKVKIEIRNAAGTTVLATSADHTLQADDWDETISVAYSVPQSTAAAAYRVYVVTATTTHAIDWYTDKIMVELREDDATVETYLDGDVDQNCEWQGTTGASPSIRKPTMGMIRGIQIRNESLTAAELVYVSFDSVATVPADLTVTSTGVAVLPNHSNFATSVFESTYPLGYTDKISFISASGTPTVSGVIWGTHYA